MVSKVQGGLFVTWLSLPDRLLVLSLFSWISPASRLQVDCTSSSNTCSKYGVNGYPTLKIFRDGEESGPYDGPRTAGRTRATGHCSWTNTLLSFYWVQPSFWVLQNKSLLHLSVEQLLVWTCTDEVSLCIDGKLWSKSFVNILVKD